jgi:hypothetical protein
MYFDVIVIFPVAVIAPTDREVNDDVPLTAREVNDDVPLTARFLATFKLFSIFTMPFTCNG